MLNSLLSIRYVYVIAAVFTLISSILSLIVGVRQSIEGFTHVYRYASGEEVAAPKLSLLDSLDSFLAALVFLIFSLGITKIFIGYDHPDDNLPGWLRIREFKELKLLLWEAILVTLVVWCMSSVARSFPALTWDALVLPAIVLALSVGLYLMQRNESSAGNSHQGGPRG